MLRYLLALRHLLVVMALGLASASVADTSSDLPDKVTKTFSSGHQQVALLELYTSEGCSSCPPADAWLGKLVDDPQLWQKIVPVAFHVDYWNYLGWKDPFSRPENSQRQRRHKTEGGVKSVYTPGFVHNGSEWRGWFSGKSLPSKTSSDRPTTGDLKVQLSDGEVTASYEGDTTEPLELQIALLGFDVTTDVTGGENRGKDLTHQFVVLEHKAKRSSNNRWKLRAPANAQGVDNLALAVWVTRPNSQQPLQATGTWLR